MPRTRSFPDPPVIAPDDRLLRPVEVEARLAISKSKLWQLVQQGDLTPVRMGGAVRFRESAVNAYIASLNG